MAPRLVEQLAQPAVGIHCADVAARAPRLLDAGLPAGVPTLILSTEHPGQAAFGEMVKRLKVGTARRFSSATRESLVEDLRSILTPHCVTPGPRDRDPDDQPRRQR